MPRKTDSAFSFISQGLPQDTFEVVSFSGEEGLCSAYRFEILLRSPKADLDIDAVMRSPA